MEKIVYTYRYLARVVMEAVTPLAVGTGEKNILTDALVALDVNGLPYIPGTSIAGVLRHAIGTEQAESFFGKHTSDKAEDRLGSEIVFTEGRMIGKTGEVMDGLNQVDFADDGFYSHFRELPIRQHVRINHRGVASDGGKFDEQVVFKGTRFCFEFEILSKGTGRQEHFNSIINALRNETLRIGGGSRSGFGEIKICSLKTAVLNLEVADDWDAYLEKTSNLNNASWSKWTDVKEVTSLEAENFDKYALELKPDDFFLFGSGMGDNQADMTPVKSTFISWEGNVPSFKEEGILIPGASVKGALAHRVAFYYNMLEGNFADGKSADELKGFCGGNNKAVRELFGYEGEKKGHETIGQEPGNVMISDVIQARESEEKLLNHVAIDRFTGGAIDGALFSEKVTYDKSGDNYQIKAYVRNKDYSPHVIEALEKALWDICIGMLPLGGGVNRGNGCFTGRLFKNGKEIKNEKD